MFLFISKTCTFFKYAQRSKFCFQELAMHVLTFTETGSILNFNNNKCFFLNYYYKL